MSVVKKMNVWKVWVVSYKEYNPFIPHNELEEKLIAEIVAVFSNEQKAKEYCEDMNRSFPNNSLCKYSYKAFDLDRVI